MAHKVRFFEDPEFLRKQSALLGAGIVCVGLTFILPLVSLELASNVLAGRNVSISSITLYGAHTHLPALLPDVWVSHVQTALLALTLLTALGALFMYRRRKQQAKLAIAALVTTLIGSAAVLGHAVALEKSHSVDYDIDLSWSFNLFFLAALCFSFAYRFIRKDEARVKSMDRFW